MIFTSKHLAAASLLTVLFSTSIASQCFLTRDVEACPANTWAQEYNCLMAQNDLKTIMDCVQINQKSDFEYPICRAPDDGVDDDLEQYYYQSSNKKGLWCTTPRNILIFGPATKQNYWKLGIQGAIQACPENDPDFHNCLCMQNVKQQSLVVLAQYFRQVRNQDLSCPGSLTKRTNFLDDVAKAPHLHRVREMTSNHNRIQARAYDYDFDIDDFGQPVYDQGQVGYRLPYFDQYIWNGEAAQRCYIHPTVNDIVSCRTWLLETPVTSALSVQPTKANYSQAFTAASSVMPTATIAPETTDIPSEQIVASGEAPGNGSAAPTATAGTTSGGNTLDLSSLTAVLSIAAFLFFL
ncbi:hypothetical protein N0V83_001200 [Neocucurbitaria cava]|uniref:Uncharacterized protein n=1 Tax=Neocucurbitaria cava TaxID=798079 RepID=A0A9W9CQ59_9PLEO|nr:hypothetical protein N0V83_001200 [Neocucurbitaria cava]